MSRGGPRPDGGRRKHYRFVVDGRKYDSVVDASAGEGVAISTISKWCNGRREGCYLESFDGKKIKPKHPVKNPKKIKRGVAELPNQTQPNDDTATLPPSGIDTPATIEDEAELAGMTPLDYMLKIMRDSSAAIDRRDKMAYWAAPYVHSKGIEKPGKKEKQDEMAKKAAGGKYAVGKPPLKRIK